MSQDENQDVEDTAPIAGRHRSLLRNPALVASLVAVALGGSALGLALAEVDSTSTTTVTVSGPPTGTEGKGTVALTQGSGLSAAAVYAKVANGVVEVSSSSQGGTDQTFGGRQATSLGTGFVIDEQGHIVTNYHVIEGAGAVTVTFANGDRVSATVVGSDPSTDVALLAVDEPAGKLTPLELGDSSTIAVGETVYAIGNPFGLDRSISQGIVSALHRQMQSPNGYTIDDAIQTDAALNSGNSGGPLLDTSGRVIGINSQIKSESGGNVGIGYAVPINTVKQVVESLLAGGSVQHAYVGISMATVTPAVASSAGLSVDHGVLIQEVRSGSPAEAAGLRQGDVITKANGNDITSAEGIAGVVNSLKPGDEVTLEVVRGTSTQTVTVKLGERPSSASS